MNRGELNVRIRIYAPSATQSANTGEEYYDYSSHTNRWAKFEGVSEDERLEEDGIVYYSQAKFTITYVGNDINEKHRVFYRNKMYDIIAIKEIGRREFLELTCESRDITNFPT